MTRILLSLGLCLSLAACGESRLNPMNWFGGDREERIRVSEVETPTDPRTLVAEVTDLSIEATTSGAILTATGLTDITGYWQPGLALVEVADGAATYEFRVAPPPEGAQTGPEPSRQIVTAIALSRGELAAIRTVTVIGRNNRRSIDRR